MPDDMFGSGSWEAWGLSDPAALWPGRLAGSRLSFRLAYAGR
jgi:hypothetical protein